MRRGARRTASIRNRERRGPTPRGAVRERAILIGRVVGGDCGTTTTPSKASAACACTSRMAVTPSPTRKASITSKDVAPGTHVVQMDTATLPDDHRVLARERVRNAGRDVAVRRRPWRRARRSDFVVEQRARRSEGRFSLTRRQTGVGLGTRRPSTACGRYVTHARVQVMLPDGLGYRAGSAAWTAIRGGRRSAERRAHVRRWATSPPSASWR